MRETDIAAPLLDEIFDALAEFGALNCRQKPSRITGDKCQWRSLAAKMLKIIAYIKSHPTPTAIFAALHAWDIDDFDDLNGHMNQKEFAKTVVVKTVRVNGRLIRKYLTKAAVNNAVLDFQKHFNLPPRRDQRNGETKNKQRTVRESQLT